MFFTIIIPTYNPRKYLPTLLDSIATNKCSNDMEIIISDDCSTEPFEDILKNYPTLNFKYIVNKTHFGFPSLGRSNGLKAAQGKWICFADQDDYFEAKALDEIKESIEMSRVQNYLITNIKINFVETNTCEIGSGEFEWTHGKFYERKFLIRNNIDYSALKYSEDIDFSVKMACALAREKTMPYTTNKTFYVWCRREDSLCNYEYHTKMLPDYIQATLNTIIEYMDQFKEDTTLYKYYRNLFLQYFLRIYFYSQGIQFIQQKDKILEAAILIRPIYKRFIQILNSYNDDLINLLSTELISLYNDTRSICFVQRPFIESLAFKDYINVYLN